MKERPLYTAAAYDVLESIPRLPECVELMRELLGMSGEKVRTALSNSLAPGRRTMLFILTDSASGQPAGFAFGNVASGIETCGEYFWLNELHVAEAHRGRGGGRALMEHVLDWCRVSRIKAVYGVCAPDNTKAAAFYRSVGFSTENTTWLVRRMEGV
jgi:GNAT superfamily N-acetyltransferase